MGQQNQIIVERRGSVAVFHINGDVTAASEPSFKLAYEQPDTDTAEKILLKFDEHGYINSGGIGVLIQFLAHTQRKSQQVAITGLSEHFKKIFRMVGITKFATIYPTMEEGLQGMLNV
jgi:anti-anti-sigma factor